MVESTQPEPDVLRSIWYRVNYGRKFKGPFGAKLALLDLTLFYEGVLEHPEILGGEDGKYIIENTVFAHQALEQLSRIDPDTLDLSKFD